LTLHRIGTLSSFRRNEKYADLENCG